MRSEENYIIDFFNCFGLKAVKIEESTDESPDFFIDFENERILIELKTKFDDKDLVKSRHKAFEQDELYERLTVIARSNPISKRIRKAADQLSSYKQKLEADYCYVFLLANGEYQSEQIGKFETSLYGDKDIIPMRDDSDRSIKKCYYYTNSDFFNNRKVLDGAFVLGANGGRLCVNSVSDRYEDVKKSKFVEAFRPGVLDPNELESRGFAFVMDASIDRSDEDSLKKYLCEKYSLNHIIPFNWPQFTVTSWIDLSKYK